MNTPIIECNPNGDGTWSFWCSHCRDKHVHGGGTTGHDLGHRGAHCHVEASPYRDTGYILIAAKQENGDRS